MQQNRTTNALEELVRVVTLLGERVLVLWADERKSGLMNPALDRAIRTQRKLLLSLAQLLFDLGLDDCKRHVPWSHIVTVETKRAEKEARCAKAYAEATPILERFERGQADAHLKEGKTHVETHETADCNFSENLAGLVRPISPVEGLQAVWVLEKLGNLANIQGERMAALQAEENRLGFINPAVDRAIGLYAELLLSVQALAFDVAADEYKRRTARQQIEQYWEQEQRDEIASYEAFAAAEKIFLEYFNKRQAEGMPPPNNTDK